MKRLMIATTFLLSVQLMLSAEDINESLFRDNTELFYQDTTRNNRAATAQERKAARVARRAAKAQDHNSTRSNKTASVANNSGSSGSGSGDGNKAQDHNSTRSNKTASVADNSGSSGSGSGDGNKAQDHNSTRSNKTASVADNSGSSGSGSGDGNKAQDHNSTRSNKTASVADNSGSSGSGSGDGNKAQDHNSTRSNKTASVADNSGSSGSGSGEGNKAQDHNSTRSNKTASVADNSGSSGSGSGEGNKAQDHNSTRSNKTASVADNSGSSGGGSGKGFSLTFSPGYGSPLAKAGAASEFLYRGSSVTAKLTADYFFGKFGLGLSNGSTITKTDVGAFTDYIYSLGYDESSADLFTSDAQGGFLLFGPVFQTGRRLKVAVDSRVGMFISSPGNASADIKGEGAPIMSVAGSNRTINPGFSGGISVRYSLSDLISIGLNSEYTGTRTGISYYDGKTRETTNKMVPAQNLVTAVTLTFNLNKGRAVQPNLAINNPIPLSNTSGMETGSDAPDDSSDDSSDKDPLERGMVFFPDKILISPPVDYNPDLGPACNPNIPDENGNLRSNPLYTGSGNSGQNPLYSGISNGSGNPLYQEGQGTGSNPLYGASGTSGNNPLYTGNNSRGTNPLYTGNNSGGTNPLYTGNNREGTNPMFQGSGMSGGMPDFDLINISGPGGNPTQLFLPAQLEISGEVKASGGPTWHECFITGIKKADSSPDINTSRGNIKSSQRVSVFGNSCTVEAIIELNGVNCYATITGRVLPADDAARSLTDLLK